MSTADLRSVEQRFYTGDYAAVANNVLAADFKGEEASRVQQLVWRAKIQTGKASDVATEAAASSEPSAPVFKIYAEQVLGKQDAVEEALALTSEPSPEPAVVGHIVSLILARSDRYSEALSLLEEFPQDFDALLLRGYLYLSRNNVEDARSLVEGARKWSQDHVSFNLVEAWTCLRNVDENQAQKAYYIFEENASQIPTARSHLGEAISQLELLRFPEAKESIKESMNGLDTVSEDILATALAATIIQGTDSEITEYTKKLEEQGIASSAVADVKAKSELFDSIITKYSS